MASCLTLLGCTHNSEPFGCGEVLNLALLRPAEPHLNIGDTLTMHVASWDHGIARQCLPPDTTGAGLRWSSANGVVAIDSLTGHLTALHPGLGLIYLAQVGVSDAALGSTGADVFEPADADSVVTIILNRTSDTARVVIKDASGAAQQSRTVRARDSTCLVTPLSDSIVYQVTLHPPPPPGSDSTTDSNTVRWLAHSALAFGHTWFVAVDSTVEYGVRTVTVRIYGPTPDPGTGC